MPSGLTRTSDEIASAKKGWDEIVAQTVPVLLPSPFSVGPFNRFDITMGEITDFEPIEKVESDIICLFFQSEFHAFANKGDELQIRQREEGKQNLQSNE